MMNQTGSTYLVLCTIFLSYMALVYLLLQSNLRVDLSWEWIVLKVEMEGYSSFCITCSLYGCDILDNRIGRLHTNFQVSATLSKKVLFFFLQILSTSTFKVGVEVDKICGINQNFFTESS